MLKQQGCPYWTEAFNQSCFPIHLSLSMRCVYFSEELEALHATQPMPHSKPLYEAFCHIVDSLCNVNLHFRGSQNAIIFWTSQVKGASSLHEVASELCDLLEVALQQLLGHVGQHRRREEQHQLPHCGKMRDTLSAQSPRLWISCKFS